MKIWKKKEMDPASWRIGGARWRLGWVFGIVARCIIAL